MARYEEESTTVEAPMRDRRFVEDDLMQLAEVDEHIRNLIQKRQSIVDDIKKANASNTERVNISDDWFEGDLKGRPVPAREATNGRAY